MMRAHGKVANEQRSVEEFLDEIPEQRRWAELVFRRLEQIAPIAPGARVLDVGAAGGAFAVACAQLGYDCLGVEPSDGARKNAALLAKRLGVPIRLVAGSAESIPVESAAFDVVHAASVIEHVARLDEAIAEIRRVLKPGGVFWFNAASALCPRQAEIRGFPLFGWYPDRLKRAIMEWVKDARPELVAYSRTPAVNWFTPSRARALLARHGFTRIHDRWDLRRVDEGGPLHALLLPAIRSSRVTKTLADVVIPECAYATL
jgi:ubiquinone/menaquinone biosynthesis C-methylase UbiE